MRLQQLDVNRVSRLVGMLRWVVPILAALLFLMQTSVASMAGQTATSGELVVPTDSSGYSYEIYSAPSNGGPVTVSATATWWTDWYQPDPNALTQSDANLVEIPYNGGTGCDQIWKHPENTYVPLNIDPRDPNSKTTGSLTLAPGTSVAIAGSDCYFADNFHAHIKVDWMVVGADLGVTKTASPDPANVGQNLTYTINVTNNGPSGATNVQLTDNLPAGVTFVSATPSQGACPQISNSLVGCALGNMVNGANQTVTIVVRPNKSGTITNSATVSAAEPDPDMTNNTASASATVNTIADLAVSLSDDPNPVAIGHNLTYTIRVTNDGPSAATGVNVTDTLDPRLTIESATSTLGNCTNANPLTCTIGNLAATSPANSASITLVVKPTKPGSISNIITVAGNESDPTPANNTASATVTVNCVDPNEVMPLAEGPPSVNGYPVVMSSSFTTLSGLSLPDLATACGFTEFDWQQTITNLPSPSLVRPADPSSVSQNLSSNGTLIAPPPFNDPPPGGYTYAESQQPPFQGAYPFYYNPASIFFGCALRNEAGGCMTYILSGLKTLNFVDVPRDPCLPINGPVTPQVLQLVSQNQANYCGGAQAPPLSSIAFVTALAGVNPDGTASPLVQWTWTDTFNGISGGVGPETASSSLPDPSSGTGGVRITSVNGVSQTPPSTGCAVSPNTLWPPNGQSVMVTISGTIIPGTQAIPTSGTTYAVTDEYGQVQSTGSVTLGAGGIYSFRVSLIAARNGNDQDGRTYVIVVSARDNLGNVSPCSIVVTVPHDQSTGIR